MAFSLFLSSIVSTCFNSLKICLAVTGHGTRNLPVMQIHCTTNRFTTYFIICQTPNMDWPTFQNTEMVVSGLKWRWQHVFASQYFRRWSSGSCRPARATWRTHTFRTNRRDFLDHPLVPEISKCACQKQATWSGKSLPVNSGD